MCALGLVLVLVVTFRTTNGSLPEAKIAILSPTVAALEATPKRPPFVTRYRLVSATLLAHSIQLCRTRSLASDVDRSGVYAI